MGELISALPQAFLDEFENDVLGRVPQEKIKIQLRQEKIARVMAQAGSVTMDGLGQRIAKIDARLYHRLRLAYAQAPDDNDWVDDMLADNPSLVCKGYRPKQSGTRHGVTFINGQAVGAGPHSEKRL